MDALRELLNAILHFDDILKQVIEQYGFWTHFILFVIIFCETGLVVTPFLPGDSLLFAAGALAAQYPQHLNLLLLWIMLTIAAIVGDSVNYAIGSYFGEKILGWKLPFVRKEYIDKTHEFYEKYGGKTIILARFVPIVRTFAPFVAGVGKMDYRKFLLYNVSGGILWVTLFIFGGFLFGNLEFVKNNFELVALAIVLLSILPMVYEYIQARRSASPSKAKA
ncbi:MAG: DedA family protein [Roseiflexaceae bacterium]|nr:DedA family protein [Roseiflexaceae bacterium]